MKTKIRLHGKLKKIYGSEFEFVNIKKPADVIYALESVQPGIKKDIMEWSKNGLIYEMIVNDSETIEYNKFSENKSEIKTIDLAPAVAGRKDFFEIILGIALVIGSFFVGPILGMFMFATGIGLIRTGIEYLNTTIPETEPDTENFINTQVRNNSYTFTNPVNTAAQGTPVPVGYGRLRIGSKVVGTSLVNYDLYNDRQIGIVESNRSNSIEKLNETFESSATFSLRGY